MAAAAAAVAKAAAAAAVVSTDKQIFKGLLLVLSQMQLAAQLYSQAAS